MRHLHLNCLCTRTNYYRNYLEMDYDIKLCHFVILTSWYENVFFICSKSVSLIMAYFLYLISLWLALFAFNPLQVLLLTCLHLIRILMFLLLGSVSVRDVIIFCLIYCIVNLGQPYSFRLRSCFYHFFSCTNTHIEI